MVSSSDSQIDRRRTVVQRQEVASSTVLEPKSDSPKVFVSYSHDSAEHRDKVLQLSNRLRADGVDCEIDRYHSAPPEGWPRWMKRTVNWANWVLVICTETYRRRFDGLETPGRGLGASWEGALITQEIYESARESTKFVPVIFASEDAAFVPAELRPGTRYLLDGGDVSYEQLYRHLTGQPEVVKPPVGVQRKLPPKEIPRADPPSPLSDCAPDYKRAPAELGASYEPERVPHLSAHEAWKLKQAEVLLCVFFSDDDEHIAAAGWDSVKLWNRRTQEESLCIQGQFYSAAISHDSKRVLTGGPASAQIWDARDGKHLRTLAVPENVSYTVAFSPKDNWVLVGDSSSGAHIYDAASGTVLHSLHGHTHFVWSAQWSPDGTKIITGSWDGSAKLWESATGRELLTLRGSSERVLAATFCPNGRDVVTGNLDGTVHLWSIENAAIVRTFKRHNGAVNSVALSGDGKLLATCGNDAIARLWEVESGRELYMMKAHSGKARAVALSKNGAWMLTAGEDKWAKLWRLSRK